MRTTLQSTVMAFAHAVTYEQCFEIGTVRLVIALSLGDTLSYKQVRDALYRERRKHGSFKHLSRGIYKWIA